jgi:hypothetical protein
MQAMLAIERDFIFDRMATLGPRMLTSSAVVRRPAMTQELRVPRSHLPRVAVAPDFQIPVAARYRTGAQVDTSGCHRLQSGQSIATG